MPTVMTPMKPNARMRAISAPVTVSAAPTAHALVRIWNVADVHGDPGRIRTCDPKTGDNERHEYKNGQHNIHDVQRALSGLRGTNCTSGSPVTSAD